MTSEETDDFQPLSVKEAIALLSSLAPIQVLTALRHTDFVMLAGLAFQGFRMDAGGYGNPIVRRRLAEEAAKNPQFATKLRNLTKEPPPVIKPAPQPAGQTSPPSPKPTVNADLEKYRAERDRLKQERDNAVAAKQGAERQLTAAKRDLIAAQAEKAEFERENDRLKQRVERIERKQRQLETTNAALRRAAVLPPPAANPAPTKGKASPKLEKEHHFAEAVRRLLGKDRESVALSLVNDVLRSAPDDADALEIKADALIKSGKPREATPVLRSLISVKMKHDQLNQAATALYKLLAINTTPDNESKQIREFVSALARAPGNHSKLAEPIAALKNDHPAAFALVKSLTPPAIFQATFPERLTYLPDAPLPLTLTAGIAVSARRLISAIDRNDLAIVQLSQEALRYVDAEEREKILASVTQAADGEPVYARVLAPKFSRGPIIVDSSNVAWHGQEMVAQPLPRLEYILAIRRVLLEKGYFPVLLIADANLPYVINDQQSVRIMVDDEQIQLVIGGSDADEHILREAQRLSAPVVSNDYMADWDPEQKVRKMQYSFTPDGKPTIYF